MRRRSAFPPVLPGTVPTGVNSGAPAPALAPASGRQVVRPQPRNWDLWLVQVLWVLLVLEIDQYIAFKTGIPTNRLPTLIAPILICLTLMAGRPRIIHWPMVAFLAMHLVASFTAENAGLSRTPFKFMVYITLLLASSATFIDTPQKFNFVWKTHLVGFFWFAIQGIPTAGKVMWHSVLANEDSFGPLMVIAMPIAYFYSVMGVPSRWRTFARVVFGLSLLGIVVSFARGAAVAAAVVLAHLFVFAKNKTRTFTFLILAALVLIPITAYFVPLDAYIKEIGSSAGGDPVRANLWDMAWRVFKTSPLYGVGAGNFGVVAERIATPEDHAIIWGSIYYRAVHNTGFQILSEEGVLGLVLWAMMIVSFFRWNIMIRSREAVAAWQAAGGKIDIVALSRGLDGSMLGFLLTSIFYNQLYVHWFWSLLIISFVLRRMVVIGPAVSPVRVPRHNRGLVPRLGRA